MLEYLETVSLLILFLGTILRNVLEKRIRKHSKRTARLLQIGYWSVISIALLLGIGKNVMTVKLQEGIDLAVEGRMNLHAGLDHGSAARIELSFPPLTRSIEILEVFATIDRGQWPKVIMARHDLALGKERVAYANHDQKCSFALSNNRIHANHGAGRSEISASPYFGKDTAFKCTDFDFESSEIWSEAREHYGALSNRISERLVTSGNTASLSEVGELAAAARSTGYFFVCDHLRTGGSSLEQAKTLFEWVKAITAPNTGGLPQRHGDAKTRLEFIELLQHTDDSQHTGWDDECVPKGTIEPISLPIQQDMIGKSWHEELQCPPYDSLALLHLPYFGFDGKPHQGELVVARDVAKNVRKVFRKLYSQRFPIERMERVDVYNGNDDESMEANNTSAFNCRAMTNGTSLSEHSYGTAIDINPRQNPYVKENTVLPGQGESYLDRNKFEQGMITNEVVNNFKSIGFKWGGNWEELQDYMHFSESGN